MEINSTLFRVWEVENGQQVKISMHYWTLLCAELNCQREDFIEGEIAFVSRDEQLFLVGMNKEFFSVELWILNVKL